MAHLLLAPLKLGAKVIVLTSGFSLSRRLSRGVRQENDS
jgi:hypothetical protein